MSGTGICLSLAPILRCVSLTRIQSAILLVPPALEVLSCLVLMLSKWTSSDIKHLLLAAEGLSYFVLALLDFLAHSLPATNSNLHIFKILDLVVGGLTFVPLFLYTTYLFLLARKEVLHTLPKRFRTVSKAILFLFLPLIFASNEVGAFVGISYRNQSQLIKNTRTLVVSVGFLNNHARLLWTFFSSLALALLTIYQFLSFLLIFTRTSHVLHDKKFLEVTENKMQSHLFRGVVYMAIGLKVGAIETVIGYAPGSFGLDLARRSLRFLARASLILGIIKGWDSVEDFQSPQASSNRRSLLKLISNPRYSTFQHVGGERRPGLRELSLKAPTIPPRSESRVTVQFPRGRAPTLHLRLSDLDVPINLEVPPKTAPPTYGTVQENFPITPSSPAPFSNLVPKKRGNSMLLLAKGIFSRAQAQFQRHSRNPSQEIRESVMSNEYRPPSVNDMGGRDAPGAAFNPTVTAPMAPRPRQSSNTGMWLSRPMHTRQTTSHTITFHSGLSSPQDPGFVIPIRRASKRVSQANANLTSRWTTTTEPHSPISSVRSELRWNESNNDAETVSWIGTRPSTMSSGVVITLPPYARVAPAYPSYLTQESMESWVQRNPQYNENEEASLRRFNEVRVAQATPEPTESHSDAKSIAAELSMSSASVSSRSALDFDTATLSGRGSTIHGQAL